MKWHDKKERRSEQWIIRIIRGGTSMIYEDAPTGSPSKSSGSNDVKTIRKNVFEYSQASTRHLATNLKYVRQGFSTRSGFRRYNCHELTARFQPSKQVSRNVYGHRQYPHLLIKKSVLRIYSSCTMCFKFNGRMLLAVESRWERRL